MKGITNVQSPSYCMDRIDASMKHAADAVQVSNKSEARQEVGFRADTRLIPCMPALYVAY